MTLIIGLSPHAELEWLPEAPWGYLNPKPREGTTPGVDSVNKDQWISHPSLTVEEARDLLRNLREAGVERLRAYLHEHMTHVLH